VVVAIAIAGPADPAVFHQHRIHMPERINHFELLQQALVEAVLEGGEERVVRLVVWFKDVEVPHENGSAVLGKCNSTGGQKVLFAGCLLRAPVSRWDV